MDKESIFSGSNSWKLKSAVSALIVQPSDRIDLKTKLSESGNFNAKESVDYKYDTSVVNGKADNGESSQNENAYIVKLKLTNGMINL